MNSSGSEVELAFLRDQVQRLNAILHVYQQNSQDNEDINKVNLQSIEEQLPPWVTSQSLMSPLIAEYDIQIKSLRQQVTSYKSELQDVSIKVERLVAENSRLHSELKSVIQGQLDDVEDGVDGREIPQGEILRNLQKQIDLVSQEKDSAMKLYQETIQEFDHLAKDHREVIANNNAQMAASHAIQERGTNLLAENQQMLIHNQKLEVANQHLQEIVQTQTQELEVSREQVKKSKTDARNATHKLSEVETEVVMTRDELQRKTKESKKKKVPVEVLKSKLNEMQPVLGELQKSLEAMSQENSKIGRTKEQLEDRIRALHFKSNESERREYEAVSQVKESIQIVENAMLEKDQALIREQQKTQEVKRLEEALDRLVNEAGKKTRKEVDSVRKQCNTNIGRLMDEIQALENENAEKQAEIERALREKRAVEEELEMFYKEGSAQAADQRVQQLHERLINAERMKDEAYLKMEGLEKKLKRLQGSHKEEMNQSTASKEQLKVRVDHAVKQAEQHSEEKLRLSEEVDLLKKKLSQSQKEKDVAERKFNKELTSVQQEIVLLKVEYEARVESIEESSRQSIKEIRQMLTAQQKVSSKWKEESKSLANKLQAKVTELSCEASRHKKRSEHLSNQLSQQRELLLQAEQRVSQQTISNRKLGQAAAEAEQKIEEISMKLAEKSATEKRLSQEKKYLEREVERIHDDRKDQFRYSNKDNKYSSSFLRTDNGRQPSSNINTFKTRLNGGRSSSYESDRSSPDS